MKPSRKKALTRAAAIVGLVLVALVIGYVAGQSGGAKESAPGDHVTAEAKVQVWTCAMHPQIRQLQPGQCPICGMDLIPVPSEEPDEALGPRAIKLSAYAMKLAEIQTEKVKRKFVSAEIRMVGKVEYDESRLGTITARVPGRLDRLYVDYTGITVAKGDHMAELYSPELLTAQEELIQSLKTVTELEERGATGALETARQTVEAVREKLRLWGLPDEQIREIEKLGTPSDHITIYAPMAGIVIRKHALEGVYVQTGTPIYTIADLSRVWVKLDAYESDLPWIKYGQAVELEAEAFPGETFGGKIAFIDPVLDARTRTVKVRVNVENPDGRLKPGMFVRTIVRANVAAGGRVVNADLAGKWISPMHPEIVKDEPGTCDVCGMPLVRAEALGYVSAEDVTAEAPLVIPASAPLITGKRAVVYVAVPDEDGVFQGREIVLGPRAGDHYLVESGLEESESVVVNGNFKIDSAVQIRAKPSMMQPEGGRPPVHHHGAPHTLPEPETEESKPRSFSIPDAFKAQLDDVYAGYFIIQQALSHDGLEQAQAGARELLEALDRADMTLLKEPAHAAWMKELKGLTQSAKTIGAAKDISEARAAFALLSESVYVVAKSFGGSGTQPILRFHCPMIFEGRGADWLQNKPGTENPYYGSQMFTCGDQVEIVSPGPMHDSGQHDHE